MAAPVAPPRAVPPPLPAAARRSPSISITKKDIEQEVERLFGTDGLVVRVQSDDPSQSARDAAFGDLLDSLRMYGYTDAVTVEAPGSDSITKALAVLAK